MRRNYIIHLLSFMTVSLGMLLTACRDELDFLNGGISDESAIVSMSVDFAPAAEGLTRAGFEGESISDVEDLCLVIFDTDGKFYRYMEIDLGNIEPEVIDRVSSDASNGVLAGETKTKRLTFPIQLPLGTYYMYALSNIRRYDTTKKLSQNTKDYLEMIFPSESVNHINRRQFCELRRDWEDGFLKGNSEMTGFVVNANENGSSESPETNMDKEGDGYKLPGTLVTIAKGYNTLHCWLRRMASKVTVTFDAQQMSDNISVFIHDVRLHDIATSAPLFTPGVADEKHKTLRNDQQYLAYCGNEDMSIPVDQWKQYRNNWPQLTRSNYSFDREDGYDDYFRFPHLKQFTHSNSAESLFFYENMQGTGESKLQDAEGFDKDGNVVQTPDGVIDSPDSYKPGEDHYKDNKDYGTYVEVRGYYVNNIRGEESEGPIIYRFMLGKNTINNYDCERNYHYKLTLQFKGRANEVDWHIEYFTEEEELYIPSPFYISYGYNESLDLPIKAKGKVTSLKATIVQNNWYPTEIGTEDKIPNEWKTVANHNVYQYEGNIKIGEEDTGVPKATALGFLTLFRPQSDAIGRKITPGVENQPNPYLLQYWCGEDVEDTRNYPLYTRTYDLKNDDGGIEGDDEKGKWSYERDDISGSTYTQIFVPLYTRERNLVKKLGYSGQNPFAAYQRRAKVKFEITIDGKDSPIEQVVDIIQVERVVNPTGIWRAWNNSRPFHVALNTIDGEDNDTFTTLRSDGGWSAEVTVGGDWILLNGGRQKIYGSNGSKIEFDYRPIGVLPSPDHTRFGIIEVRYHDYSCVHKIFVRQGYKSVKIDNTAADVYWHTFNMETKDKETVSPLDEGSMFRYGKWDYPIASSNNYNDKNPWINVRSVDFKSFADKKFTMADDGESKLWTEIGSLGFGKFMDNNEVTLYNGKIARMMTLEDIKSLRDNPNNAFAFGVLYGDEASSTLFNVNEVYGYKGYLSHQQYGMRGCFVYNKTTGAQVFFPIGSAGYGKRQNKANNTWKPLTEGGTAVLKYAGNGDYITHERADTYGYMKALFTQFRSQGAMYWIYETKDKFESSDAVDELDSEAMGLDLNYFTYDFNPAPGPGNLFTSGHAGTNYVNCSDAVFIRLVQNAAP